MSTDNKFIELKRSIGKNIQQLRKSKGIAQQELAGLTGLDRVSIGYIEQGIRAARLRSLLLIAKALEVDIKKFF